MHEFRGRLGAYHIAVSPFLRGALAFTVSKLLLFFRARSQRLTLFRFAFRLARGDGLLSAFVPLRLGHVCRRSLATH